MLTRTVNTATVAPSVLATSNGESGSGRQKLGSTSKGSSSDARRTAGVAPAVISLAALLAGGAIVLKALWI